MEITPYRRHSADCKHKDDRYHPRCGCPLWFQFNWSQANTTLDGNKLRRGQNKWSAETRIWSGVQTKAQRLSSDLESLLQGKPVRQNITVKAAVDEWLKFRGTNELDNTKADLMGRKLTDWCETNDVVLLSAITTERVMKFRMSLPFRTGDSSSLSVHWAVIGGFFSWAEGKASSALFSAPGHLAGLLQVRPCSQLNVAIIPGSWPQFADRSGSAPFTSDH